MKDGDLATKHLSAFNIVISQLFSIDIKITQEDKCISMLYSLSNSWGNLVVSIGRNNTTLKLDNVVVATLSKEMRKNNKEGSTPKALIVRGLSISRKKGKPSIGRSKSRSKLKLRSISPI